jgi:hypothetical protein
MCIQGRYGEFGNLSQPQLRLGIGGETMYRPVTFFGLLNKQIVQRT